MQSIQIHSNYSSTKSIPYMPHRKPISLCARYPNLVSTLDSNATRTNYNISTSRIAEKLKYVTDAARSSRLFLRSDPEETENRVIRVEIICREL